jgi:SagB-type dehydrogenase family enzyme
MAASPAPPEATGARTYHDRTKHSWQSVRSGDHFLDWEVKPLPFKVYSDAPVVSLPREIPMPDLPALEALARGEARPGAGRLDLATLAVVLFFSAGLTKKKTYPGGEAVHFRAAASTGALYEIEVYVVAGAVGGLDPGVYHFDPADFALRRLRAGDYRAVLRDAAGEPEPVATAPATLVLSAIYWRNTWKYQARAFRHFFWNAGTLLANLLATAVAADLPARVLVGFADAPVNDLLGLDVAREASVVLVPLGPGGAGPAAAPPVEPLALATVPLSAREVDYPLVRAAHAGTSLPSGAAARAWVEPTRGGPGADPEAPGARPADSRTRPPDPGARPPGPRPSHPLGAPALPPSPPLGTVILRRGSTREFAAEPIPAALLATMLDLAGRPVPLDVEAAGPPLCESYLLVHAVDGLPAGAYAYEPAARGLRQLRAGDFRREGGYLCLEQALGADASAVVFFLADLDAILRRSGERAYRAVNLLAGLQGGRLYLAAYALGLGASGLTFYDDDVVRFFSPDAQGKDAIFVTALGRAHRPGRTERRLPIAGAIQPLRPGEP